MDSPSLSVCIPTFNGAAYLAEAIDSVLKQTYSDFELIVVDDASTDDTMKVIQSFNDSRLRIYHNPSRLGLVENWNKCLSLSRGKYVCIFHQDDVMLPENLEQKVTILDEHLAVGLVYSNVQIIDTHGHVTATNWFYPIESTTDQIIAGLEFFETLMLHSNNPICCPSVVARRTCYETTGGFDLRLPFTADLEMWARLSLFCNVAYLAEPLLNYRWHHENESHNFRGAKGLEAINRAKQLVLEKYPDKIPDLTGLKGLIRQRFQQQAVKQAIYHYLQMEEEDGQQCLALALTRENTDNIPIEEFQELALDVCFQLGQQLKKQRQWSGELEQAKAWLDRQHQNWRHLAAVREEQLKALQAELDTTRRSPIRKFTKKLRALKNALPGKSYLQQQRVNNMFRQNNAGSLTPSPDLFKTNLDPDIKLQKHIFIYSPCGRTASTALQRILNSSNEVCIWGEPFGFDTFILEAIHKLEKAGKVSVEARQQQYQAFLRSFAENKHDKFYPLAFQPFDSAIKALEDIFMSMLMPLNNARRFGYKNIAVGNINILHTLRNIFPNCYLIFLFRNPLTQWVSIREVGFFPYSDDIDQFLDEYSRISKVFIKYFNDTGHPVFIENKVLLSMKHLASLLEYLEISQFDRQLLSRMVSSIGEKTLSDGEKDKILASTAYKNYEKMLELANKF